MVAAMALGHPRCRRRGRREVGLARLGVRRS